MVKKVGRGKGGTTPIDPTKAVETQKVSQTQNVSATEKQQKAKKVRRPTRPMTPEEREHLFKLIHEEAEKLFGPNGLPQSQRDTVETAVKMAIEASIVEEED